MMFINKTKTTINCKSKQKPEPKTNGAIPRIPSCTELKLNMQLLKAKEYHQMIEDTQYSTYDIAWDIRKLPNESMNEREQDGENSTQVWRSVFFILQPVVSFCEKSLRTFYCSFVHLIVFACIARLLNFNQLCSFTV